MKARMKLAKDQMMQMVGRTSLTSYCYSHWDLNSARSQWAVISSVMSNCQCSYRRTTATRMIIRNRMNAIRWMKSRHKQWVWIISWMAAKTITTRLKASNFSCKTSRSQAPLLMSLWEELPIKLFRAATCAKEMLKSKTRQVWLKVTRPVSSVSLKTIALLMEAKPSSSNSNSRCFFSWSCASRSRETTISP